MSSAQNQHYVPKFILRQFLAEGGKEQVFVFDKMTNRTFRTSISNIMAERRFNDFVFADLNFTFEPRAGEIEQLLLPVYRDVVESRLLRRTSEERSVLALFVAFQMERRKNSRERFVDTEAAIRKKVEASGQSMQQVEGWEPLTPDVLKRTSLMALRDTLSDFAALIEQKEFFLMTAPPGTTFYLGDDPVCLTNERTFGPYGNIGLAVPGIQISMPLSSDLMLCCWCPTVRRQLNREADEALASVRDELLRLVLQQRLSPEQMKQLMKESSAVRDGINEAYHSGTPIVINPDNVIWYNAKQMANAYRHVICARDDFELALDFNRKHPGARRKWVFG